MVEIERGSMPSHARVTYGDVMEFIRGRSKIPPRLTYA